MGLLVVYWGIFRQVGQGSNRRSHIRYCAPSILSHNQSPRLATWTAKVSEVLAKFPVPKGVLAEKLRNQWPTTPAEDFFAEFQIGISRVAENPRRFHFDRSGLRRCNLERFLYHLLYDIRGQCIGIWVLRHDRRDPDLGSERFPE